MVLIIYHELENSSSATHNLLAEFQWPRQFFSDIKGIFLEVDTILLHNLAKTLILKCSSGINSKITQSKCSTVSTLGTTIESGSSFAVKAAFKSSSAKPVSMELIRTHTSLEPNFS